MTTSRSVSTKTRCQKTFRKLCKNSHGGKPLGGFHCLASVRRGLTARPSDRIRDYPSLTVKLWRSVTNQTRIRSLCPFRSFTLNVAFPERIRVTKNVRSSIGNRILNNSWTHTRWRSKEERRSRVIDCLDCFSYISNFWFHFEKYLIQRFF